MGSVKDLIVDDSKAGKLYKPPSISEFGIGAWQVKGTFSVGDLKKLIPETIIKNKAQALTMAVGNFFEWFSKECPDIPHCYLGVLDNKGEIRDTQYLLDRGELSDIVVMKLAHTPDSFCNGNLEKYRDSLYSGKLQCGVADVESIFRKGFPLGSSTFKRIFGAVGMEKEYAKLATYDETVKGLDKIRNKVQEKGLSEFPKLKEVLSESGLDTIIPNPGFVLKNMTYDTTTKFEEAGDRHITKEEARLYSGLSDEGSTIWETNYFPRIANAQQKYCNERNILNIDGKGECVAYKRSPVVTDFLCSVDENREMIKVIIDNIEWAIPSNKEIQRAIFKQERVDMAKIEAKYRANRTGNEDKWKDYMPNILNEMKIDLKEVARYSCNLMEYAMAEIANRTLGRNIFDTKPVEDWARSFIPYASKIEMQK